MGDPNQTPRIASDPNHVDHVVTVIDTIDSLGNSPDPNRPTGFSYFYVNGEKVFELSTPFGIALANGVAGTGSTNTQPMIIGARFDDTRLAWDGDIEEPALYDYALSEEQVLAHFNCGM